MNKAILKRSVVTLTVLAIVAFAALLSIQIATAGHNADGLVGYWNFDDETADDSAHDHDGDVIGAEYVSSGVLGSSYALSFDGADDYVEVTAPGFLDDSEGSVVAWFKLDDPNIDAPLVITSASVDGNLDDEFLVQWQGNAEDVVRVAVIENGTVTMRLDGDTVVDDTGWHQVVVTSDGASINLYVDGVLQTLTETTGANTGQWFDDATDTDTFTIGGVMRSSLQGDFSGDIDEVRVYDQVLTLADIKVLAGNTRFHQYNDGDPVDSWSCKEDSLEEWHFVINQIRGGEEAPESITVLWENGATEEISSVVVGKKVKTAHYSTQSNLDSQVVDAVADLYDGWSGNFNLSHGPCGSIEVTKVTDPEDYPQDFEFNASYGDFFLGDGDSDVKYLNPGSYNVDENVPAGWDLEAECAVGEEDPVEYTPGADFDLAAGDVVMCTFTNTFDASLFDDLVLWLNASTLGLEDSDPVSLWEDQSGNNNDATGASDERPEYIDGVLNGQPVVRFDGVDDWMSVLSDPSLSITDDREYEILVVFRTDVEERGGLVSKRVDSASWNPAYIVELEWIDNLRTAVRDGVTTVDATDSTDVFDGVGHLFGSVWAGDDFHLYLDGVLETISDTTSVVGFDSDGIDGVPLAIGTHYNGVDITGWYDGDIAEILIYDRALSSLERDAVEAYLQTKYGL